MKTLISTIGIVILLLMFNIYQFDFNLMTQQKEQLKYNADEAASTAILFFDPTEFSYGQKVIEDDVANRFVKENIKINLDLDSNMKPVKGYWKDTLSYKVYYFDDSNQIRVYRDETIVEKKSFFYGDIFTEPLTGYKKMINQPTVIVTLIAGKPSFRFKFLNEINIIETSAYEYR